MKLALHLIFALFVGNAAFSQQYKLDSLLRVWNDPAQPDSIRAKAYQKYIRKGWLYSNPDTAAILADVLITFGEKNLYINAKAMGLQTKGLSQYLKGDYANALKFYTQSTKIFEQLSDLKGVAASLGNIGNVYWAQGEYATALEYLTQGLKLDEKLGDQKGIAASLSNIGNIYGEQGDFTKALDYYTRSLKIGEQLGDRKEIANSLHNIGIVYHMQGNYTVALDYYTQSIKMEEQSGNQQGMANGLNNIGSIYSEKGDYSKAMEYYLQSLNIYEQVGDQQGVGYSLNNIGFIYNEIGEYSKALDYCFRSLIIEEQLGDKKGIASALRNIGNIYRHQGNYTKAIDYCKKGFELSLSISALITQKNTCQCLYDTYKAMGKGNEALVYLEKIRVIEVRLKNEETSKKLQQMEFSKLMLQDSIAKAEEARLIVEAHQAEVRKKNQTRNVFIGASLFLLLLAGGLYSRWRYTRRAKAIIEKEKDRSESLLLNILPAEIAEELKQKGRADARDFDRVSILFTDFKGFTEASANLSAQDLVTEINTCFEAFDGIMAKYGIEKIKTIGDAYMAAGGLPVPTADSVKNTVLAALEMQDFITRRKAEKDAKGEPAFEMRVGIHTGPVVAGIVGVKKFQYDIWGDTVNTASRMESSGEVGKVNISQSTFELLKNDPDFAFENRGKIEAKGKGEIEMYFVETI